MMSAVLRRSLILLFLAPLLFGAEPPRRRAAVHPSAVAAVKHIFIVILENTDAAVAEGLPFIRHLAANGAILLDYRALTHPSQPNYIALVAGNTHGVSGSEPLTINAQHLGDLIEQKGLTWKVYAEHYPGNCFLGETFGNVADGQYVRRHVPFLSFRNVQQDAARCAAHVVNASALDADLAAGALPNFSFYVPDNQHNGHDSSPLAADMWLAARFGPLLQDPRLMTDTLFIVTYDESSSPANFRVTTVFTGSMVRRGVASFDRYNHYDLLRTIENLLELGSLRQFDAAARPITGVWQ